MERLMIQAALYRGATERRRNSVVFCMIDVLRIFVSPRLRGEKKRMAVRLVLKFSH
jgi:tRNA G37 N-methylase Trm5